MQSNKIETMQKTVEYVTENALEELGSAEDGFGETLRGT